MPNQVLLVLMKLAEVHAYQTFGVGARMSMTPSSTAITITIIALEEGLRAEGVGAAYFQFVLGKMQNIARSDAFVPEQR